MTLERGLLVLVIFIFGVIGAWIGLMAMDNEPPFHYLPASAGSRISPDPVHQEGMVRTEWELSEVKRDCPRTVARVFTDRKTGAVVTTLDATPLARTVPTGKNSLSRAFQLPPGLPAETGFRAEVCFQCNALQMVFPLCISSPELPINVIP